MNWIRRFMVMLSVFLLIAGFPTLARAAWVSEGKARRFTGFHHPDAIVFADGMTWRWKDVSPK